jgi:ABC-type dipeptide/oligopeptide/nickel transport system permease subunit
MAQDPRWKKLLKNPSGAVGAGLTSLFIFLAIFGSWVAPYDPNDLSVGPPLEAPSSGHWMGTDELGRDQTSRVIDAAQIAVTVSVLSVAIALVAGSVLGIIAGYRGGWTDKLLVRLMDVMFSFPALLLAIVIVAVLGPGLVTASIAIAIVYTPRFARVARSTSLSVRQDLYIEAAKLSGVSSFRIARRHVLPNISAALIVLATLSMSTAQLAYASLSFLGLGTNPPNADYGSMLARARNFMTLAPWLIIFPAIALILLIVGFNLLGDALRDVLDPRSETEHGKIEGVEAMI